MTNSTTYPYPLGSLRLGVDQIADPIDRIVHRLTRAANNSAQSLATAQAEQDRCPCMRHGNKAYKLGKEAAAAVAELQALQALIAGAK